MAIVTVPTLHTFMSRAPPCYLRGVQNGTVGARVRLVHQCPQHNTQHSSLVVLNPSRVELELEQVAFVPGGAKWNCALEAYDCQLQLC